MIHSLWDLFFVGDGREPIAEELSGGQLLPPVRRLAATSAFARGENAYRVPQPQFRQKSSHGVTAFCYGQGEKDLRC